MRIILLLFCLLKYGHFYTFPCSDEYSADYQLYGSCITQNCGRHLVQISTKELELIGQVCHQLLQAMKWSLGGAVKLVVLTVI